MEPARPAGRGDDHRLQKRRPSAKDSALDDIAVQAQRLLERFLKDVATIAPNHRVVVDQAVILLESRRKPSHGENMG